MSTDFTEMKREHLARALRQHTSGEVRFDRASRHLYSTDASIYQVEPLGVVIPRTVEDVVAVVQIAGELGVPITARGGGTSLSGQSIGPGVVLDVSKYLNTILAIDPQTRTAWVQPGVVLDQLNHALEEHGLQFGPDVATANRANLGGMIGNNSAGARSIVYGKTADHVRRLDVVLADGRRADFGFLSPREWDQRAELRTPEGALYRQVRDLVRLHRDEIQWRFPRILRRVSGYNLDYLCDVLATELGEPNPPAPFPKREGGAEGLSPSPLRGGGWGEGFRDKCGLHQLVIGSEGTLAIVTEAELNLLPRPKHRGLLVPQFSSLAAAMDALAVCLEFQPSAVELMDRLLLELSAQNLALREVMQSIPGPPQALFMVEFSSDNAAEVADRVEKLQRRLQGVNGLTGMTPALDAGLREPLWNLRRAAMPLLYSMPGDRKPITFVEDCAVSPARLPEFSARFRDILHRHGTDGSFYGHASVGCLHIRPVLNLKSSDDVARMRRIASEVTDLVLEFGGSLSGEHGDGMVRSEWNEKMFGPVVYGAFRQVKAAFDPHGVLNPGKVVEAAPMTENLRYGPQYKPIELPTVFDYSRQEGFLRSIEMCNGAGACRKHQGGTMCPSYRATCEEADSTRGRANALRRAISGEEPLRELRSRAVHDILELCLMCKACKAECPSNVDMAKLKAEWLELYYAGRRRPLGHRLVAHLPAFNRAFAWAAPLVNWGGRNRLARWLLEKLAGLDRRRSMPPLHRDHFRRWFARQRLVRGERKVLLLDDCFTSYNEPAVGQAAVRLLERAGCEIELGGFCCGRTLISKGFVSEAKALVSREAPRLAARLADGTPLLGVEPSCLLTLADEWPELLPGPETRAIAQAVHLADHWLARESREGRIALPLAEKRATCVLHTHCHQRALLGTTGTAQALKLVPGLEVKVLDAGCCGMAGSFGFEHYDVSVQIANLALLPALAEAPEAVVVAPGTSCRHQILDLARRRALHPLEVLAEQL
jgi:FAD/FMN-containing dehydrogenase/Fe-S oxidoreductase